MNPSTVVGRTASLSQISPSTGPLNRIRKECVREPSSKCDESGKEENALSRRCQLMSCHRHEPSLLLTYSGILHASIAEVGICL